MSFTIEKFVDHEQWLATRRQHVTATEIAALASGGRDTWDRIRREKETGERSFTGNRFTRWGQEREPIIADFVSTFLEESLRPTRDVYVLDGSVISCTPDMIDGGAHLVAELKTKRGGWDEPPQRYLDQIQVQLLVTGADHCLLVMEPYDYADDGQFEVIGDYWFTRIYPDPDRQAHLQHLVDLFVAGEYPERPVPAELQGFVDDYLDAKQRMDDAKHAIEEIVGIEKNTFDLEGATVTVVPDGKTTRLDGKALAEDHPEIAAHYYQTSPRKGGVRIKERKEAA